MNNNENNWKEWVNNKIYLLSTPLGAGVGLGSLLAGVLIGQLFLAALR
jgi:uncharacterized membrane protein YczE